MSNIFILVKCKNFLSENITKQFIPSAIENNFLWIGGNSLKDYHINQYRGPTRKINLFKKEVINVLQNAKNKKKIKCFSILSGNKSYLDKPSEHYFSVDPFLTNKNKRNVILLKPKKIKEEKLNNVDKNLIKVISKLKKTNDEYYLPITLSSFLREHPVKIAHNIFIKINVNDVILQSENKHALKNTKLWLKRLSELLEKVKCF